MTWSSGAVPPAAGIGFCRRRRHEAAWNRMRGVAFAAKEPVMPTKPTIARIWRGRTRRDLADAYQTYLQAEGIPPLIETALGVQQLREDRDEETWFTTISYWADIAAMTAFTKGEPSTVHHLARDAEFLIELPQRIEIHRILIDQQGLR
jgi:heme-degrading monooxygenase HmoA